MSKPLPAYSSAVRYTVQDVINWLAENKFSSDCVKKFREASVDGNKLLNITSSDLRQIEVNRNDGSQILKLVGMVSKPNERRGPRGGHNQNNISNHNHLQESESEDDLWSSDEFDDVPDDDGPAIPQAPPRHKRDVGRQQLPAPPPGGNSRAQPGPPQPRRPMPSPPAQEPEEEAYEDPYAARYPGKPPLVEEENYEDPDAMKKPAPPPQRQPQPNRHFGKPAAPPPTHGHGREPAALPPEPPRQPPRAGRPPPAVPQEPGEIYEEVDEEPKPAPVPSRPQRPRAPMPSPPQNLQQEDYEEIVEKAIETMSQQNARKPHIPGIPLPIPPSSSEEVYEDVDEQGPATPSPAKSRAPASLPSIPSQSKPVPPRSAAPPIPSHRNLGHHPTPKPPVAEETYEMPDMNSAEEDDNYLEMDEENIGSPPPLPSRPGANRPPIPSPESESGDEDYLDMEDDVDIKPPPRTEPRLPPKAPQTQDPDLDDYEEPSPVEAPKLPPPRKTETARSPPTIPQPDPPKPKRAAQKLPTPPGYTPVKVTPGKVELNGAATPAKDLLDGQRFYHGDITRQEGEAGLLRHRMDGMYLIRRSTKVANQPYTLQLYFEGETFNLPILKTDKGTFKVANAKSKEFPTITEAVNHFKQYKLILKGGRETTLKKSLPKS